MTSSHILHSFIDKLISSYRAVTLCGEWRLLFPLPAVVLTLSTYIIHRDVVTVIVPFNLAAFPPSLEVNADIA